ncbi:hypothetical protein CGZ80_15010 [Rhodopirellula sp. MGV]|nr:hypothetical protein CGZ80_15010 [Rhodopirellula sp. MGV]
MAIDIDGGNADKPTKTAAPIIQVKWRDGAHRDRLAEWCFDELINPTSSRYHQTVSRRSNPGITRMTREICLVSIVANRRTARCNRGQRID